MSGTIERQVVEALADPSSIPPEGLLAPGAVTWHSFDEVEAPTVPDTFASLVAIRTVVPDFTMTELRTGDGYAQYVVTGTLPDGSTLRAPAALRRPRRRGHGHAPRGVRRHRPAGAAVRAPGLRRAGGFPASLERQRGPQADTAQKPRRRSWRGSRCQSLATLTNRSR